MIKKILLQLKESFFSVIPIYILVIILNFTPLVNLKTFEIVIFTISTIILIIGITFFNLGASIAMTPMGKKAGEGLTKQGKIGILLLVGFVLGFLVTIAEPDLQVLSKQTEAVFNSTTLIFGIGLGVGLFLLLSIIKTIKRVNLSQLLMFFYMILFACALLTVLTGNEKIIALAFDSGGVTTGPITVPFLMALGLGISKVVSKKSDKDASFGLIALCSVGPILVVLLLSIFSSGAISYDTPTYTLTNNFALVLAKSILEKMKEVGIALILIVVCFLILNAFILKLPKKKIYKMGIGVLYTYIGLVLFLAAVDSAYIAIGYKVGCDLATKCPKYLLVIIAFIIGGLTVLAEPAIAVLKEQVEEITNGLVKQKSLMIALIVGVGLAIALSVIRIIFGFNILYYLIPGYIICLGLSFFIPKIYTAIAFDSGGVASGPLTSSFILPMAIGICFTMTNDPNKILTDAFGVVSLVAMSPLITIEALGLIAIIKDKIKSKKAIKQALKNNDRVIIEFN